METALTKKLLNDVEKKAPCARGCRAAWKTTAWRLMVVLALVGAAGCTARPVASPSIAELSRLGFRPAEKEKTAPAGHDFLMQFETEAGGVYRLGEGDEITIDIWDRPELSGRHLIGPDGRVSLPIAGPVRLAGYEREGAAKLIAEALSHYYLDLVVSVRVEQYVANRVVVLGRVTNPGIVHFETMPTLLEALARAGGLPILDKQQLLTRCAIIRGRDRIAWVDLKGLLSGTDPSLNLRLRPQDLVYVPDSGDTPIYILGEVKKPGAYRLTPEMSLLDALSQAGGATEDAVPGVVRLIRPGKDENRELQLSEFLRPGLPHNVALEEGDVVYLPKRGIAEVGYVIQKLNPFLSFFFLATAFK